MSKDKSNPNEIMRIGYGLFLIVNERCSRKECLPLLKEYLPLLN
jgi:hypothetical protein